MNRLIIQSTRVVALAVGLASASSLHALVLDTFDTGTFIGDALWDRASVGTGNTAFQTGGSAVMRARNSASATSSIFTKNTTETANLFNFFDHGYTVGAEGVSFTYVNVDPTAAYFRMAIVSEPNRQFKANDAITLRLRYDAEGDGGLALFGYKMNQADTDGEIRTGTSTASSSLQSIVFDGTLTAASISLDPVSFNGTIATVGYTVSFTTTVDTYSASGTMDIDQADWGDGSGFSSLTFESRRNLGTAWPGPGDSDVRVDIDTVTYTAIPEPATYAAFAGLGVLALAVARRRRAG